MSRRGRALRQRYGSPRAHPYKVLASKLSTAITKEMNKGNPDFGTREAPLPVINKFEDKVIALADTVRALNPTDMAWRFYDKDIIEFARYKHHSYERKYALGKLRQLVQMVEGAASRMKT